MTENKSSRAEYPVKYHELRKFREKIVWNPNLWEIASFLNTFVKTQDTINTLRNLNQDIQKELESRIGYDFPTKLSAITWFIQYSFAQKAMDRAYELAARRSESKMNLPKSVFFYDFASGIYDLTHTLTWAEEIAQGVDIDKSLINAISQTVDADSKLGASTSTVEQAEAYLFYNRKIEKFAQLIKYDNTGFVAVNYYLMNAKNEFPPSRAHIPEFFAAGVKYAADVYKEVFDLFIE